ncbi:MAG: sodium:solute symporter family protein [Deltaproteobacteria bacterium]|nr:sodium:solute symporter family protein [Deltaproteobacteria bacterium]MBW2444630.1 sodium:solute symporter family protein [Deltaproteobacteria bacterium]
MSFGELGVAALCVYVVAVVCVAELARRARQDLTPADHFLAGRGLGAFILFLTLYATAYSGNSLLGYPGEAYRRGFSWIMSTGFMMAIIVVFHLLAPKLRPIAASRGFLTPGDWLRHRFGGERWGRAVLAGCAVLMTWALANFLLAQLTAMGHVTSQVTEGIIPAWAGVIGLAALILAYETLGGMRAVAWTDAAQSILMLFGLGALLVWVLGDSGGLEATTRAIVEMRPEAVAVPDLREKANWVSTIVLLGLASVVYPQAIQRIYAARSGKDLARSFAWMSFMPLVTTTVVFLIGIAAIPRLAGLDGVGADTVMPKLLAQWAAEGPGSALLAALVFVGALAAIMSTADSVLLSLSSIVAIDLLGRPAHDAETTRLGKRISTAIMAGMVILALTPRLTLWRLIELKMELLIQCVPAFLIALHWKRLRAGPTFVGIVLGACLAGGAALLGTKRIEGVHVGVIGLALNALVAVLGSLWMGQAARAGNAGTATPSASAR